MLELISGLLAFVAGLWVSEWSTRRNAQQTAAQDAPYVEEITATGEVSVNGCKAK